MRDPRTPEEWQEAADTAAGLRLIADCGMYGLLEGTEGINVARCDEILRRAAEQKIIPPRPALDIAYECLYAMALGEGG